MPDALQNGPIDGQVAGLAGEPEKVWFAMANIQKRKIDASEQLAA